ncbi:hypothetical protein N8Z47_00045 [Salibacteraceae bacterium]|nr:hypothetical protein [Salibacteraceae bacterium]
MLDAYYVIFSGDFAYYGVVYDPRGSLEILLAWICLITTTFFVDFSDKKVSNSVHMLLYIVCFVPSTVIYTFNSTVDGSFFYGLFGVFLAIGVQQKVFDGKIALKQFSLSHRQFLFLLGAIYAILGLVVLSKYGLAYSMPDISEVYTQRKEFKAIDASKFIKYALSWLASVLNLALILYATINRKYLLLALGAIGVLYFYSLGGHKSYLFAAPFALAIMAIVKVLRKDFNLSLALFLSSGLLLLLVFDQFSIKGYTLTSSLFVRRSLLLPSQIYFYYCEYFQQNGINFFAHNFPFSSFMTSAYAETAPVVIGREYFSFNDDVYANGNVFADVFHNAGYLGYILISVVLPSLYLAIDYVCDNKNRLFTIPMVFMAFHVLINTGLFVSLITHGIVLCLFVIGIYPNIYHRIKRRMYSTTEH